MSFYRPTEAQSATPGKNQVVSNQKKINKFIEKQGLGHSKAIGKMIENLFLFMVYSKSVGSSTSQKKFKLMKVHVKHGELFLNKTTKVKKSLIKTVLISI